MKVQQFPSRAGLKTAGTGLLACVASAWFARVVLTVPAHVFLLAAAGVAVFAGAYLAGWAARGRTDGR